MQPLITFLMEFPAGTNLSEPSGSQVLSPWSRTPPPVVTTNGENGFPHSCSPATPRSTTFWRCTTCATCWLGAVTWLRRCVETARDQPTACDNGPFRVYGTERTRRTTDRFANASAPPRNGNNSDSPPYMPSETRRTTRNPQCSIEINNGDASNGFNGSHDGYNGCQNGQRRSFRDLPV